MIFDEIASGLGPNYRAEVIDDHRAKILDASRPEFGIFFYGNLNESTWLVCGIYPKDKLGNAYRFPYGESEPKIKLSLEKSVSKIVADIKRRFMGDYEAALGRAVKNRDDWNQRYSSQDKNKQRFLDLVDGTTKEGESEVNLNKIGSTSFHRFRVNSNNVDMDLWNVPFGVAEKILRLLKENS